jgi:excisionase family DNA binding protein
MRKLKTQTSAEALKAAVAPRVFIEPIAVAPRQAAEALSTSVPTIYGLMRDGKIESYLEGRNRRIVFSSLRKYIESLPRHQGGRMGPKVGEKAPTA